MKKWISYILMPALLITALPAMVLKAAETDCTGRLTANGSNINISLSVPQAATEKITSLHFRVNVSIKTGKMDAPSFQFKDTLKSEVKDSRIINAGTDGSYIADIVLSGKKDKIIFPENGQADIGTISLKPSGSTYKISVNFTGTDNDNTNPAIEYVTDNGQLAQKKPLVNTEVLTIENKAGQNQPVISSSSYGPSASATKEPDASASPSPAATDTPLATASPLVPGATDVPPVTTGTSTPGPQVTEPGSTAEPPAEGTGSFNTDIRPSLSASVTKGSRIVKLKWNKTEGADGYIIYSAKKNGSYKRLKVILEPDKTLYNAKMSYASSYLFKMRAFKNNEDGSRIFGKYSKAQKATTAPARLKGLKARISGTKVNLSWKNVKNADGYQIYAGRKKNGSYSIVKTLKKGSVIKTTVKKSKKTNYFKARAYVKNAAGKRVYGNFCKSIKTKY